MGHIEAMGVGYVLPDGRELFGQVGFRVGDGAKVALVGPNGAGRTTLLRMVAGELTPPAVRAAGERLRAAERGLDETERSQVRYADALTAWGDAGGYAAEVAFDTASVAVLDVPWDRARDRLVGTLSGGEQKRFACELLLRGPDEVLLLDEPTDNLDLASAEALEQALAAFAGTVLAVTHDRWFTRGFDRFVVLGGDGEVRETPEPVWAGDEFPARDRSTRTWTR